MDALVLHRDSSTGNKPSLRLQRLPVPVPGPDAALIKVKASKLNPSDALNVSGGFSYTTYPRVPGRDYAGIVEICESDPLIVGKKVFGTSGNSLGFTSDGAHAEYIVVPAQSLVAMPDCLDFVQACSIGVVYTTALLMITRAHLEDFSMAGRHVLIIGESGNVGSAISRILSIKYPDIKITAANRRDGEIDLSKIRNVHVVFSAVPNTSVLQQVLSNGILATGGKLVYVATSRPSTIDLHIAPLQFYRQDWSLIGVNSVNCSILQTAKLLQEIANLVSSGRLTGFSTTARQVTLQNGIAAYEQFSATNESMVFTMQ